MNSSVLMEKQNCNVRRGQLCPPRRDTLSLKLNSAGSTEHWNETNNKIKYTRNLV